MKDILKLMKPEYQRGIGQVIAIATEKHDYCKLEKVHDFLKKISVNS